MSDLIGYEVEFKTIHIIKYRGLKKTGMNVKVGKILQNLGNAVIIAGNEGGLYNRPINEITILRAGV